MFNLFKKEHKQFDPNHKIRYEYRFQGNVQNIGFRFEIQQRATKYNLTGWARNNEDGSVTCQLQGEQGCIDKTVQELNEIDRITITAIQKKVIPIQEEYDFIIRY